MDFYGYLLVQMGFEVSEASYFLVCNANRNAEIWLFDFQSLIPYHWDSDWIPSKIQEMINLLNSERIPEGHTSCKNCAYARQRKDRIIF